MLRIFVFPVLMLSASAMATGHSSIMIDEDGRRLITNTIPDSSNDRFGDFKLPERKHFSQQSNSHPHQDLPDLPYGAYKQDSVLRKLQSGVSVEASNTDASDAGYLLVTARSVGTFWGAGESKFGSNNQWTATCSVDDIYRTVSCTATRKTISVHLEGSEYAVLVGDIEGASLFSPAVIRVDDSAPFELRSQMIRGEKANKIVGLLKNGRVAITRYSDYKGSYTDHVSLQGLSEAIRYMLWLRSKMLR